MTALILASGTALSFAQTMTIAGNWRMQDATQVSSSAEAVASSRFNDDRWYRATVPGTVLTTLVNNKVYPEPFYGENMRAIPESLNKVSYWYRTPFHVPNFTKTEHVWLHFGGINYAADVWVNGHNVGSMRGAFIRGSFDVTPWVSAGADAILAVLIHPQPHPGTPHEHTIKDGIGKNGGESALDGPTFLSTVGWDWIPAVRDRDTGIWQPVELEVSGPGLIENPFVTSDLAPDLTSADLTIQATLRNVSSASLHGQLIGTIAGQGKDISFQRKVEIPANESEAITFRTPEFQSLHITHPKLWWPNGYGPQNLSSLTLRFVADGQTSNETHTSFGIRSIEYSLPGSDNLAFRVNGVRMMIRGGDWALDEGMKRESKDRIEAQFRMHAQAHLNMVRNWVGQSTSPEFYEMADRYGMLVWDEFFQPNPGDGPDVSDEKTYLANVQDKVLRYRSHPSIALWCARNEGFPPKQLDDQLRAMMASLDPQRLYQSSSTDGRGVSSHGPYYWRAPRFFYAFNESFKTETGSVSIPTMESIQGMMPRRDWEVMDDDWAQHDLTAGAQRGDEFPQTLAHRYGHIRNLADFARKGAMADYETFRGMYEGRNAEMFKTTTGILTWLSNPAQPSFVWQLYHYDLDPTASLFAVQKAAEPVHIQLNQSTFKIEAVNNLPLSLKGMRAEVVIYNSAGKISSRKQYPVDLPNSSTIQIAGLEVNSRISPLYFVQLNLYDKENQRLSTNLYWQHVAEEDYRDLELLPTVKLDAHGVMTQNKDKTLISLTLTNSTSNIALLGHVQLHRSTDQARVLPSFYSDNYVSLVPGESVQINIDCSTKELDGGQPVVLLDGYNVAVGSVSGAVAVEQNLNALPTHWPPSSLVPAEAF